GEYLRFLRQFQQISDQFDRQYFTLCHFCGWSSFSYSFPFFHLLQQVVYQTETCDNEVIQVHSAPPQFDVITSEDSRCYEPLSWQAKNLHIGLTTLYTHQEWACAFQQNTSDEERRFLPILVGACEANGFLEHIIPIDLTGLDADSAYTALAQAVKGERR